MERAKLIVKNFGPLKDIEIEVREMVTFIGAQASGKSTLAKLISIFEDENFRSDSKITFENELKKYNILSYLKDESYIEYKSIDVNTTIAEFIFSEKKFKKNTLQETLSRIKEIDPKHFNELDLADRIKKLIRLIVNAYNLINKENFYLIFETDKQKIKFEIDFLKIRIKNDRINDLDVDILIDILGIEKSIENYIFLYDKIISVFPNIFSFDSIYIPSERNFLHLIAENTLGLINNNIQIPKHLLNSGQDYEKALQTIKELPLSIVDKKIKYKREGKTSYIYHNQTEKVDLLESASGLQSIIPILLLVEYSKSLKDEYNFNFVVEEPELNLYPKAQHELIKYLVKNCLEERKNLILTTHSPFVLASINNLLLAFDKGKIYPKEVNKIIKKESWLNPKNFIAYELKNGKAKKIMDDKLGQIKENMIDSVSDSFSDEFDKLLDL
ncbi:AAA family ATPase [Flavobacterium flavipallidum]|uniref:AAA family ATPase n=1 Tax=Flavobacterium flavipallidum TaxID=3139140 RepID=A0ABU9HHW2_9FLAO